MPALGFLPAHDARVRGTLRAARALEHDGFVRCCEDPAGPAGREGAYLPCSLWYADALAGAGSGPTPGTSSNGWRPCATTSACCPNAGTPAGAASSATPPGGQPRGPGPVGVHPHRPGAARAVSSTIPESP